MDRNQNTFTNEDRKTLTRIETLLAEVVRPQVEEHERQIRLLQREKWMFRAGVVGVVLLLAIVFPAEVGHVLAIIISGV